MAHRNKINKKALQDAGVSAVKKFFLEGDQAVLGAELIALYKDIGRREDKIKAARNLLVLLKEQEECHEMALDHYTEGYKKDEAYQKLRAQEVDVQDDLIRVDRRIQKWQDRERDVLQHAPKSYLKRMDVERSGEKPSFFSNVLFFLRGGQTPYNQIKHFFDDMAVQQNTNFDDKKTHEDALLSLQKTIHDYDQNMKATLDPVRIKELQKHVTTSRNERKETLGRLSDLEDEFLTFQKNFGEKIAVRMNGPVAKEKIKHHLRDHSQNKGASSYDTAPSSFDTSSFMFLHSMSLGWTEPAYQEAVQHGGFGGVDNTFQTGGGFGGESFQSAGDHHSSPSPSFDSSPSSDSGGCGGGCGGGGD